MVKGTINEIRRGNWKKHFYKPFEQKNVHAFTV